MVRDVHGTLAQTERRYRETDEIEDSKETENTVDEDGDTAVARRVVADSSGEPSRNFPNRWPWFLLIFCLE